MRSAWRRKSIPGAHVAKVGVRIGAVSGVEPEALSFGFTAWCKGRILNP